MEPDTMQVFLAAAVIFGLAFLGLAIGTIRKKRCLGCSCKAARKIMEGTDGDEHQTCGGDLVHLE